MGKLLTTSTICCKAISKVKLTISLSLMTGLTSGLYSSIRNFFSLYSPLSAREKLPMTGKCQNKMDIKMKIHLQTFIPTFPIFCSRGKSKKSYHLYMGTNVWGAKKEKLSSRMSPGICTKYISYSFLGIVHI